jgi:hypothetical protein
MIFITLFKKGICMKQLNLNQLHLVRGGINNSNAIPASSEGNKTEDENTNMLICRSGRVNISSVDADAAAGDVFPAK